MVEFCCAYNRIKKMGRGGEFMKLRTARGIVALCATAMLGACATRPDIESTTGANATEIAQAIRCEIRDSIINIIAERVAMLGEPYAAQAQRLRVRDFRTPGAEKEESARFGSLISEAKAAYQASLKSKHGPDELAAAVVRYSDAAIVYDFDLNMRQTNDVGGSVDLLATLTAGTIKGSPGASFQGRREATRTFRLIDQFGELLTNKPTIRVCNDQRGGSPELRSANAVYPVAGTLRLERLVRDFITFNQSANLVGTEKDAKTPTMTEIIEFATTLKAGIEPELELKALGRGVEATGAKLTLKTERYDRHKVILTFALPARPQTVTQERSETVRAAVAEQNVKRKREDRKDDALDFFDVLLDQ